MASAAHKIAAAPAALPPLPDEILEDIFVRLDDAADLARASAACTTFRRVVSASQFLRRFRSLHRPPILGFLSTDYSEFHPVDPPHRSAAAGAALAQAADFDFSFVKRPNCWSTRDVRDSRVLLAPFGGSYHPFKYLVVCDPLHRRFVDVPPIPGDLLPASPRPCDIEAFLDPVREEEDLPVRVICNVLYRSKVVALVFSSDTGKWETATTFTYEYAPFVRHYAHNCFYWIDRARRDVLVLNPREMKFSTINIPLHLIEWGMRGITIVNSGENRLGLLAFGSDNRWLELYSMSMGTNGVGSGTDVWRHDKTIPLPNYHFTMIGAPEGNLVLHGVVRDWTEISEYSETGPKSQYFIVDLKALLVEKLCVFKPIGHRAYPFACFPPPFSLPSV